jgi:ribosomal silencing factor RsfS
VKKGITLFKIQFQEVLPVRNTTTANSITQERRANPVRKRIANAISNAGNVLANKSGDQMTGWLIVVLVVVVVGAVFMTLYQGSITTIWTSIVDKITGLLN